MIKFLMGNILYVLLAVGVVFNLFWLGGNRSKLKMNTAGVVLFSVIHTVVGVLIVKIFAFLESGTFNGMSIFGAVGIVLVIAAIILLNLRERKGDIN